MRSISAATSTSWGPGAWWWVAARVIVISSEERRGRRPRGERRVPARAIGRAGFRRVSGGRRGLGGWPRRVLSAAVRATDRLAQHGDAAQPGRQVEAVERRDWRAEAERGEAGENLGVVGEAGVLEFAPGEVACGVAAEEGFATVWHGG